MKRDDIGHDAAPADGEQPAIRMSRPNNHLVAIVDTREAMTRAVEALKAGGFLDSEIHPRAGIAAADALHADSGHGGLVDMAVRFAERIGVADDDMEVKSRYEQALRDGRSLVAVEAPTEARLERATQILQANGAHTLNFMGRFSRTEISPPHAPESRP